MSVMGSGAASKAAPTTFIRPARELDLTIRSTDSLRGEASRAEATSVLVVATLESE